MADGPREALWHILDPTDGPILKACGNQRRLIDAGSTIFARKPVGALLELPIQDVIETVHGGDPYAAPLDDRDRLVVYLSTPGARLVPIHHGGEAHYVGCKDRCEAASGHGPRTVL